MKSRVITLVVSATFLMALARPSWLPAQVTGTSPVPYPNAVTDRAIHSKTPRSAPKINTVFYDPDFGARMVE